MEKTLRLEVSNNPGKRGVHCWVGGPTGLCKCNVVRWATSMEHWTIAIKNVADEGNWQLKERSEDSGFSFQSSARMMPKLKTSYATLYLPCSTIISGTV